MIRKNEDAIDSPEQIQKCLHCNKPYCNNCMYMRVEDGDLEPYLPFLELHKQGLNDREIAERLGKTPSTVQYFRRRFGLEANKKRRTKNELKCTKTN